MAVQPDEPIAPSNEEVPVEPAATDPNTEPETPVEPDYKALAESNAALAAAQQARADAAEALIIKNKNINKRTDEQPTSLTEERVLELIRSARDDSDESPEAKALADAQATVKTLAAQNAELIRGDKSKDGVVKNPASTHRDPLPEVAPKLAAGSPLADFKHLGNGIYSKKLASGKTMYKNTKAQGNERKTWVE